MSFIKEKKNSVANACISERFFYREPSDFRRSVAQITAGLKSRACNSTTVYASRRIENEYRADLMLNTGVWISCTFSLMHRGGPTK